jgi:hypothetical protein
VDKKTKMVVQESEAHLKREKLKAQKDQAKNMGNTALADKIDGLLMNYNLDKQHHMNAVDLQGNVGVLKLKHKAMLALRKAMDDLMAQGVNPRSVENGRFFVIERFGRGNETSFAASVYREKVKANVNGVDRFIEEDKVSNLLQNQELLQKIKVQAANLETLYVKVTPEEEREIVHGGAEAVDRVFASKGSSQANSASSKAVADRAVAQRADAAPSSQLPNNVIIDEDDSLDLIDIDEESVASATTVATPKASPAPSMGGTVDLTSMSSADFEKLLAGLK